MPPRPPPGSDTPPTSPWALCCTNNKKWPVVVNEIPKAIILNFNSTEGWQGQHKREGSGREAHWVNLVFNFIFTQATLRNSRWIKLFKMSNNYSNANGTLTCALCKEGVNSLPSPTLLLLLHITHTALGGVGIWPCVYKASYDLRKILALFTVAPGFVLYAKQAGKKTKRKEWKALANYICQGIWKYILIYSSHWRTTGSSSQSAVRHIVGQI